ncbi:hypothetical protein BG003_002911 [Podila horticola]|nr:hypothetical protein BG003_002911 [Podila horticola]
MPSFGIFFFSSSTTSTSSPAWIFLKSPQTPATASSTTSSSATANDTPVMARCFTHVPTNDGSSAWYTVLSQKYICRNVHGPVVVVVELADNGGEGNMSSMDGSDGEGAHDSAGDMDPVVVSLLCTIIQMAAGEDEGVHYDDGKCGEGVEGDECIVAGVGATGLGVLGGEEESVEEDEKGDSKEEEEILETTAWVHGK